MSSSKRIQDPNERLREIHEELGITADWARVRDVEYYEEAPVSDLELVSIDFTGKPFVLARSVTPRWTALLESAAADGIIIKPFSGFRSYLYQRYLINNHLKNGRSIDDVLTQLAAPGCSEHHTGRAVDLTSESGRPLGEEFEKAKEFKWLTENAVRFGFVMSFPRDNPHGYIYEPWHWCFQE